MAAGSGIFSYLKYTHCKNNFNSGSIARKGSDMATFHKKSMEI